MRIKRNDSGDTIIEVLFAITVFSLVAVGGLSLMNQGTAMAQRALEIGLVRQQIDSQADALRYINSAYIDDFGKDGVGTELWNEVVVEHRVAEAQDFDEVADADGCNLPNVGGGGASAVSRAFALNVMGLADALEAGGAASGLVLVPTNEVGTYAQVRTEASPQAEGIWVQAVQKDVNSGFYDFHIRACWFSPGQSTPVKLGTIVRLYEPR